MIIASVRKLMLENTQLGSSLLFIASDAGIEALLHE